MRQLIRILVVLVAIISAVAVTQTPMIGACVSQSGTAPGNPFPCD